MEITINIPGLKELADGLNKLAVSIEDGNVIRGNEIISTVVDTPAVAPLEVPVETPQAIPVETPTVAPTNIPTAEVSYTVDDLSKAAMGLMDLGKQPELMALLSEFGVQSLPELDKARYGEFATKLRTFGAQI